jgi:hypothetical protein
MPYVLIRHKVTDFENWKPIYDAHGPARKTGGSKGAPLFRDADNPNATVILFERSDLDRARRFAESQDLRQAMTRAGVADRRDFLDEAGRSDA